MASAATSTDKGVDREIANLNERIRVIEQDMSAVKEFIKEALVQGMDFPIHRLEKQVARLNERVDMDFAFRRLEKQVDCLNERVGGIEQILKTVKDLVIEIKKTTSSEKGRVKMTEAEIRLRIEKSLCFFCDEKYSENHDCKNQHLQLHLIDDDEMGEIQKALAMKSIVANDSATFKFRGKIGSKEVIVKISSAATHNFISRKVVAELQLPVERTRRFRVNFGFGHKAKGAEICKNFVLKAQGMDIIANFFPTNLGVADVMLGWDWLKSVGAVLYMGSPQTATFEWNGRTVTLQSDPSLTEGIEVGYMTLEWDDGED